jgi:5-methylcytosine-specific restriction enzyme subunit McrC
MTVVKSETTVFEYGHLGFGEKAKASPRIEEISIQAYEYLKKLCLCDESESRFLRLKLIDSCEVLQVQNYAGVLLTPDGTQIEILPKVAKKSANYDAKIQSRASLLMMLKALKNFRHLQTNNANLAKNKMPLLELFISQFLASVNELIKRGLRSDYVRCEDNSAFLKGKLLVGKQVQHNFINKHKFYVEYDEYVQDRPVNRLLHIALKKVSSYSRSANNQKLTQELLFAFAEIPLSSNIKNDFASIKLDRGMNYYQVPLAWARLILDGLSPLTMKGQNNALSLLFPMEAIFESYTAYILAKTVKSPVVMTSQVSSVSLVNHNDSKYFRLKPDLVLSKNKTIISVLDSKWKLLDQSKNNGTDKYGLSQADFYQMFAYGHKYMNGEGEMFLIYPKHENFTLPIEHSFDYSQEVDKFLKLFVMPICIDESTPDNERLIWPKNAYTKIN